MKMRITLSAIVEVPENQYSLYDATTAQEVVDNQRKWYADGSSDIIGDLSAEWLDTEITVELVEDAA